MIKHDHIYVAPPHLDVTIDKGVLRLSPAGHEARPRPINRFLSNLAREYGHGAVGVILSGTMTDGTDGICDIKRAGGYTLAQDESTAKFDSMPKSAAAAGCVDYVLPPDRIAQELCRIARRFRRYGPGSQKPSAAVPPPHSGAQMTWRLSDAGTEACATDATGGAGLRAGRDAGAKSSEPRYQA
ncbi:MAG: hypothetical protein FJZ01_20240, partial [Candidatus Sericytochromatia bacterium]|nr:hypothetical protein [Candidatus Tanganyikabacteria bacterium]